MISKDFANWLVDKGFGVLGISIFKNYQPDAPDNCITIYDTNAPNITESSSLSVDQYSIKLIIRNSNADNGALIMESIHSQFIGFGGQKLANGLNVTRTEIDLSPYCLGKDPDGRTEWTLSYNLRVQHFNDSYRL